jgi:hypothetical protein
LDKWPTFRTRRPPGYSPLHLIGTSPGVEPLPMLNHNLIISRNNGLSKRMLTRVKGSWRFF